MTGPTGLLDFYVLEASEYLDQMDALLASSSRGVPDTSAFLTSARALRGSSTMARLPHLADLAGAIERVGRAVREGALGWSESVRAILIASVDDFRILLRAVRAWSPDDEQRVIQRVAELRPLLAGANESAARPETGAANAGFFATEIEAIAGSLDAFQGNPRDPRPLDQALARVRALRGIAALKDFPPLGDVTDAIERAASVRSDNPNAGEHRSELFAAATALLTRAAVQLRSAGVIDPESAELTRFVEAGTTLDARLSDQEHVVPIARLFFADGGPHVVATTPVPVPGAAEQRFRTEIITHAEHLHRLVADARSAKDIAARERASRELRGGLRAIRQLAESFGFGDIARFFSTSAGDDEVLHPVLLASLDDAAVLLASDATPTTELRQRLEALQRGRIVDREIGTGFEPIDHGRRAAPAPATPPRAATPLSSEAARQTPPANTPPFEPFMPVARATPPTASAAPPTPQVQPPRPTPPASPARPATPRSTPAVSATLAARGATPPTGAPAPFEGGTGGRRTPVRSAAGAGGRRASPSGRELRELLQHGIAGLRELEDAPLSAPASLDEAALIPIEALVYRGRAALARALELRDVVRTAGPTQPVLEELFDLLELASRE